MNNVFKSISTLLTEKLKKITTEQSITRTLCIQIYSEIFNTIVDVMKGSNIELTNEAMNLISQMFYLSIEINNNSDLLDENIFDAYADPKNIETKELALLATIFNGTPFAEQFIIEIKRRS